MSLDDNLKDSERGVFSFHGLTGYFITVSILLTILATLAYFGLNVQQRESTNYYKINQDLDGLTTNSKDNHKQYILIKDEKEK